MKLSVIIFTCMLTSCLFLVAQGTNCPSLSNSQGSSVKPGTVVKENCSESTCQNNGTWATRRCPILNCIGYTLGDPNAPYPRCCPTCRRRRGD